MRLRIGDPMPDFQTRSDDGQLISPATLRGEWALLYFYPRASSSGCSLEARRFEQALPDFARLGARVIGVSTDTEARQARFREQCQLSFALLPDGDKAICRVFGVLGGLGGLLGMAQRQSFLFDSGGLLAHHWRSVNPDRHAAEVLGALEKFQTDPSVLRSQ
ncbi:peroxiredoxin [Deinococcus sp.]|uniref:peroxiredoxin n=1 Tax=Deinococcus sp. TaxID=47478 RepID=UPI003CC680D3